MMELRPMVIDNEGIILGGNMRFKALQHLGFKEVPDAWVKRADELTEDERRRFIIADNVSGGEWDVDDLAANWDVKELEDWGLELDWPMPEEIQEQDVPNDTKLIDSFIIPPFSILDTRQGYWQERKRYWRDLIGDNGESREGTLYPGGGKKYGVTQKLLEFNSNNGVSLLDPVLAEIVNKWFGLDSCNTFDCFAGDSVFGYLSDALGNTFTGIELRQEQADLNNQRLRGSKSKYICDDGQNVLNHIAENSQDLLFSCPPYFDLEVYSDLPNDASNQKEYTDFLNILDTAFTNSLKCLKDNRFAVITVGDIRNKQGFYYRFVDDIKDIFKRNGALLYNELIIVEPIGTTARRAGKSMESRKVAKTHQNVLVFFKGDPKQIKEIYPKIELKEYDAIEMPDIDLFLATEDYLSHLLDFRKPFIKDKLIMYFNAAVLIDAIRKNDITLAVKNGEIVGYLWLHNLTKKPFAKIEEVCSAEKGLGTKLMLLAETKCKHNTIKLEVVDYNTNAINFYLNRGYKKTDTRVSGNVTNIIMQKELNNESTNL